MRAKKHGFTLIELLVVIAIIAILAAILFPVFASAKEKAKQSVCLSNLKQLSTALSIYSQNYNDKFIASWPKWYGRGVTQELRWDVSIRPYLKNKDVFRCPSLPNDPVGYGYHFDWLGNPYSPNYNNVASMGSIAKPSKTICIIDNTGSKSSVQGDFRKKVGPFVLPVQLRYLPANPTAADISWTSFISLRHNDGALAIFADGHVSWLSLQRLIKHAVDGKDSWWDRE